MRTQIKELTPGTFFIHENEIKCIMWVWINRHLVVTNTINLEQNSILEQLTTHSKIEEMNPEENVELLNIDNWKLSLFHQSNYFWFLVDCEKFTFFNFAEVREKIMNQIKLDSKISKNQSYWGDIILTIKNGKLNYDEIKLERNMNFQTEIEKINFLLFHEINDRTNVRFRKDYLFRNLFTKNNFFVYINKVKENLNLEEIIEFSLWKSLNILSFSVIEADFYTALINIRQVRNLIVDFIYDNTFDPQNFKAKMLGNEIKKKIEIINEIKSRPFIIDDFYLTIEQEVKKIKESLQALEKWNKKYEKNKEKQIWQMMVEEYDLYNSQSLFYDPSFESIDQYLEIKPITISKRKVFQYIENEILKDKSQMEDWRRANYWTNNSVHKNNFDTERFQNWYLSKNELNLLKKTLSIYINVFNIFKEEHLGLYSKSYNLNWY